MALILSKTHKKQTNKQTDKQKTVGKGLIKVP